MTKTAKPAKARRNCGFNLIGNKNGQHIPYKGHKLKGG